MVVLFCALDPTSHYCTFILSLCGWVMLGGLGVSVWAYMCVCVCAHIQNTLVGASLLLSILYNDKCITFLTVLTQQGQVRQHDT